MMKAALTTVALAALLVALASAQTAGQVRGAPIVKGVTTGDLASQVDQARQQSADLLVQVNRLEGQVSQLSGRVEALEFELSQTRTANNNLMTDNESLARDAQQMQDQLARQARAITALQALLGVETDLMADTGVASPQDYASAQPFSPGGDAAPRGPAPIGPEGSLGTLTPSQLPTESGALFAEAKSRFLRLDYAGAEAAFQEFLDKYSGDPQTAEALFWLGESLHQQDAYAASGQAYTSMIRSYPNDPRAADAFVRLARSMRLLGENQKACQALNTLPERYPNATKVVRDIAAVERTRAKCSG